MWSIMKVDIIYYVPAQISYLGKIWFPRYSRNALDQSGCSIFKSNLSPEQNDEIPDFLHG